MLEDPGRPDWYKGALFNELYFMVDGGTLWTDGPPMPADGWVAPPGADPAAGGPFGRFAQIECFDYPFYNTLDVDFYASFARLQLWPELERQVCDADPLVRYSAFLADVVGRYRASAVLRSSDSRVWALVRGEESRMRREHVEAWRAGRDLLDASRRALSRIA